MCREHVIRLFAGAVVLLSVALALLVSPYWLIATAFVGANLFQSAITKVCPLAIILRAVGVRPCAGGA